jgi:hypothetical protein
VPLSGMEECWSSAFGRPCTMDKHS